MESVIGALNKYVQRTRDCVISLSGTSLARYISVRFMDARYVVEINFHFRLQQNRLYFFWQIIYIYIVSVSRLENNVYFDLGSRHQG
jgi:hypothetical protein